MGPKRKEKESDTQSQKNGEQNCRPDPIDDLFYQAFEKPTQIYRFLRTRHLLSPIFLHRTLSYMKERCCRTNSKRSSFRVDSMFKKKSKELGLGCGPHSKFMTLAFLSFHSANLDEAQDTVQVETFLRKIGHKKRKEVSCPIMQVSFGTSQVHVNPGPEPPPKVEAVSIVTDELRLRDGTQGNSYVLLLRTKPPATSPAGSEPSAKRRRLSDAGASTPGDSVAAPGAPGRLYGAELVICDRHSRCLLVDGDYELTLHELKSDSASGITNNNNSKVSWSQLVESSARLDATGGGCVAGVGEPMLKFRLEWADEALAPVVDRPKPFLAQEHDPPSSSSSSSSAAAPASCSSSSSSSSSEQTTTRASSKGGGEGGGGGGGPARCKGSQLVLVQQPEPEKMCVRYQFLFHSNRRQQTEARFDLHCPWCLLNCLQLAALLKHLRHCHSRLTFSHSVAGRQVRIDVSVNESYDGTYTGNPHDLIAQPGHSATGGAAFGCQGPSRRTPITVVLIWRPRRLRAAGHDPMNLEALDDAYEVCVTQRPFITGHNRLYHHTSTCLPIQARELDVDSEGETDPEWLRVKTCMMIDEFTDVNEGEKELMKMWNLHVLKYNYVGDCQMPLGLQMFLEAHGPEILERNLYRNFVLHLCNLYDFGIVAPATVLRTVTLLQTMLHKDGELGQCLAKAWLSQFTQAEQQQANGSNNSR